MLCEIMLFAPVEHRMMIAAPSFCLQLRHDANETCVSLALFLLWLQLHDSGSQPWQMFPHRLRWPSFDQSSIGKKSTRSLYWRCLRFVSRSHYSSHFVWTAWVHNSTSEATHRNLFGDIITVRRIWSVLRTMISTASKRNSILKSARHPRCKENMADLSTPRLLTFFGVLKFTSIQFRIRLLSFRILR